MAGEVATADAYLQRAREAGATEADVGLIQRLRDKAAEFETYYQELRGRGAAIARLGDNQLMQEYGDLLARAETIREKIRAATAAIDKAIAWAKGTFGVDGLSAVGDLSAIWFLPAAVIMAAIAVIGYWVGDYVKFSKRFVEQERIANDLIGRGMDPAEANRQAAAAVGEAAPGLFGSIPRPLVWALLLGVGFMVYRQLR